MTQTKLQNKAKKNLDEIPLSDSPYQVVIDYLNNKNVMRNEVTGYFERGGRSLTEQDINELFVSLCISPEKAKGLNRSVFDSVLNSTFIETVNPIKGVIQAFKPGSDDEAIRALFQSLQLKVLENLELTGTKTERDVLFPYFKKWLIGMIASVYADHYNPLMIVLIGPKGCGKTEFFRRLLPASLRPYFAQSKFVEGKDSEALMCEKLLILNDELDGLHSKEARAFRNLISSNTFTYRPPYGRQNVTRKRLAAVCGTANDRNVVAEAEHNRRIIPIEIIGVRKDVYNQIDKELVIGEAYHLFKSGFDWNLTPEEFSPLEEISREFEHTSMERELVQQYFIDPSLQFTGSEITKLIQDATGNKVNHVRLGQALNSLGYERKKVRRGGGPVYVWQPPKLK